MPTQSGISTEKTQETWADLQAAFAEAVPQVAYSVKAVLLLTQLVKLGDAKAKKVGGVSKDEYLAFFTTAAQRGRQILKFMETK